MVKISTMIRLKPLNKGEDNHIINLNLIKDELILNEIKKSYDLQDIYKKHIFNFDKIYNKYYTNDDIFNDIGLEIIDNLINNINSTIYVFGQTGTGKTHTIIGTDKNYGVLRILLNYLIDIKKTIKICIIEIYNDTCYDILNDNKVIHQREDYDGNIKLNEVKYNYVNEHKDINYIYNLISKNRSVGTSSQNKRSSRSHLQIKIQLDGKNFIKILDLAGSERASQNIVYNKMEFRENAQINKSLLSLKECIRSLKNKNSHIPIRGSKLTKLLKDSFLGKCNTYVLGTISQEKCNIIDSIQTLNYISDLKYLKKIDKKIALPEVKLKKNQSVPNYQKPKNFNVGLSPNYKYLLKNRSDLQIINQRHDIVLDKILKKKTTKILKNNFIEIINKKIENMNKLKNELQTVQNN